MKAISQQVGDVTIVLLSGKLELGQVSWLKDIFAELYIRKHDKVILDMKGVKKIDNACIHELETIQDRLQSIGGKLELLHVQGVSGFTLATLTSFDVYDDKMLAITNF
jgi:anti-anti-sigma regulatory factor